MKKTRPTFSTKKVANSCQKVRFYDTVVAKVENDQRYVVKKEAFYTSPTSYVASSQFGQRRKVAAAPLFYKTYSITLVKHADMSSSHRSTALSKMCSVHLRTTHMVTKQGHCIKSPLRINKSLSKEMHAHLLHFGCTFFTLSQEAADGRQ